MHIMRRSMTNWIKSSGKSKPKGSALSEHKISQLITKMIYSEGTFAPGMISRRCERCGHTRGASLSCGRKIGGPEGYTPCKKPGRSHDPSATYQDQKGGNNKRGHLAGKYWSGFEGGRQGLATGS